MAFKLINARPSPFGRKVAIALIEKGLPFTVEYDLPWGPDSCTPQHSPLQQLPILITETGESVYESAYILEWLERRYPEPALLPSTTDALLHQKLVQTLAERLMEIAQMLIFEVQRPAPSSAWIERQSAKMVGGLAELERQLDGRSVAADQQIMLGDIATASTLLAIEFAVAAGYSPDLEVFRWRRSYPGLDRFVAGLEPRPSLQATRPETMDVDLGATVN